MCSCTAAVDIISRSYPTLYVRLLTLWYWGMLASNYNLRPVCNFINMDKIRIAAVTPESKQERAE